jgi:hypothetical protein
MTQQPSSQPDLATGRYPLSFNGAFGNRFTIVSGVRIAGHVHVEMLQGALDDVGERHEYRDYPEWQKAGAADTSDARAYWREKLRDARVTGWVSDYHRVLSRLVSEPDREWRQLAGVPL